MFGKILLVILGFLGLAAAGIVVVRDSMAPLNTLSSSDFYQPAKKLKRFNYAKAIADSTTQFNLTQAVLAGSPSVPLKFRRYDWPTNRHDCGKMIFT